MKPAANDAILSLSSETELRQEFEKYLIELDREKFELCAQAIHELKSPLSIIRTTTDLIDSQDPKITQSLLEINNQITRASSILRQLMTMMKLNLRNPDQPPVDAVQIIFSLIQDFRPQLDSLNKTIIPLLPAHSIAVPLPFETIAKNLIENAILHSPSEKIKVTLSQNSNQIKFSVTDFGPPIPSDLQERIFEKFFQGPSSQKGSGLGLYLVSQTAFQLDGEVSLSSSEHGNTFTVILPLSSS